MPSLGKHFTFLNTLFLRFMIMILDIVHSITYKEIDIDVNPKIRRDSRHEITGGGRRRGRKG